MSARELVLGRIRAALRDVPADEAPLWDPRAEPVAEADYVRARSLAPEALVELFAERVDDYRATVTRCAGDADSVRAAVLDAVRRHTARRLAVPGDLDPTWIDAAALELLRDGDDLGLDALDAVDGALTGCLLAIAVTGTIVLDAGPGQGRRALSLIPDLHICVVRAEQIVAGVPEAVARMRESALAGRPLTLISGPSATSDIQLVRVEGVHGPRQLEVIVTTA